MVAKMRSRVSIFCAAALISIGGVVLSCGIEEYSYVGAVSQGNISVELNNKATIRLPSAGDIFHSGFTHFGIVYRIYVSEQNQSGQIPAPPSTAFRDINPSLYSSYQTIYPYTDPTNTSLSGNISGTFSGQGFYELTLEGSDIRNVLNLNSAGGTVVLEFPAVPGTPPTLTLNGGTAYRLFRSLGRNGTDGINNAYPNNPLPADSRYFLNHSELNAGSPSPNPSYENMDVAGNSIASSARRYTYASLYILSVATTDGVNYIYSKPAFIGVLKLPESS
jgi:hypothetical protein